MTDSNEGPSFETFSRTVEGMEINFQPLFHQDYANAYIQTGITDHEKDHIYLLLLRGDEEVLLLLRSDEASAIAWELVGAIHSILMTEIDEEYNGQKEQETQTSQQQGIQTNEAWQDRATSKSDS